MLLALILIGFAIVLFASKSMITNNDLERLANIASIIIFILGIISLIFPLPAINSNELFQDQLPPTSELTNLDSSLSIYTVPLNYGCQVKELVAHFEKDEVLSIEFSFPTGFFSRPSPSHVSFILKGADFENGFRADEILSYSIIHEVIISGEYRVGFIWHGRYDTEAQLILPKRNWQIVVSDC